METPDSVFRSARQLLPTQDTSAFIPETFAAGPVGTVSDIIVISSILLCILYLRRMANVLPSIISCLLRWKESINLEDSVKLGRDRNITAAILALPFILTVYRQGLLAPDFSEGFGPVGQLFLTAGLLLAYLGLRTVFHLIFRPKRLGWKIYSASYKAFFSFFIAEALLVLITTGICRFAGCRESLTHDIVLYETGFVFLLFAIRKAQIFGKYCSFFKAILYLCGSEILPAGILVSAAIFL